MKKNLFIAMFILMAAVLTAQTTRNRRVDSNKSTNQALANEPIFGFDKTKLTFGGGIGLQFGSYTMVNIAPQVGYNFSELFNAGAGISYMYYKNDFYYNRVKYNEKRHYAGFNIYGRFYPVPYIVFMLQPEANRMWRSYVNYKESKFVASMLVGGGVRLGGATIMLQYDVAQNDYSPYGNNIFYSIGYSFGL